MGREQPLWQEGPRPLTSIQPHCFLLSQQETEAQEAVHFPQFTQFFQGRARTTDKSTVDFTSLNSRPRNLVSGKRKDCWWQREGLGQVWRLSAPQPKLLEPGSSASLRAVGGAEAAQPSLSPHVSSQVGSAPDPHCQQPWNTGLATAGLTRLACAWTSQVGRRLLGIF